jgi:hypothetical protein
MQAVAKNESEDSFFINFQFEVLMTEHQDFEHILNTCAHFNLGFIKFFLIFYLAFLVNFFDGLKLVIVPKFFEFFPFRVVVLNGLPVFEPTLADVIPLFKTRFLVVDILPLGVRLRELLPELILLIELPDDLKLLWLLVNAMLGLSSKLFWPLITLISLLLDLFVSIDPLLIYFLSFLLLVLLLLDLLELNPSSAFSSTGVKLKCFFI